MNANLTRKFNIAKKRLFEGPWMKWSISDDDPDNIDGLNLNSPYDVCFYDNNLVVADTENKQVVILDGKKGELITTLGKSAISPVGVAFDRNSNHILVVEAQRQCILHYDVNTGQCVEGWGKHHFKDARGIGITSNGSVVVSDIELHCIKIREPGSRKLKRLGSYGTEHHTFRYPMYLNIDSNDRILISDTHNNCIKTFDMSGNILRETRELRSEKPFGILSGISTMPNRNIIVCDYLNNFVSMLSNDGHYIRHLLSSKQSIEQPTGVSINSSGTDMAVVSAGLYSTLSVYSLDQPTDISKDIEIVD
ncbi:hypothetical protein A3Q56_03594 [Intoshia linei]|uniref:Uncharacterized protein n=1 Tax=Intoshia linei TaxID=1819745 RepID=A0A177B305_9BILA|nr:hypothetical protein A3Q56_03594 [Intoshia linei]